MVSQRNGLQSYIKPGLRTATCDEKKFINQWPHSTTELEGMTIHFIHKVEECERALHCCRIETAFVEQVRINILEVMIHKIVLLTALSTSIERSLSP
jgi:hypothetical protein